MLYHRCSHGACAQHAKRGAGRAPWESQDGGYGQAQLSPRDFFVKVAPTLVRKTKLAAARMGGPHSSLCIRSQGLLRHLHTILYLIPSGRLQVSVPLLALLSSVFVGTVSE